MSEDKALVERIADYLSGGGLFNPEQANHEAVRDLLIECREALSTPQQPPAAEGLVERIAELERAGRYIKPYLVWTIGPESPGHHPTMPSAVAAFLATLTTGADDADR